MNVRLKETYQKEVIPALLKELALPNPLAAPTVSKVVVNMGVGNFKDNADAITSASRDLTLIAGQKAAVRKARQSVAGFKLRAGEPVGLLVTLREERMWVFLDKLFNVVLPRVRDFRGLSEKAFDGYGNYNLGIEEHTVFPEIDANRVDRVKRLGINITTTAEDDRVGGLLLEKLGLPLKGRNP